MSQTVIEAKEVSKRYRLGVMGSGRITEDISRWWNGISTKKKAGQEKENTDDDVIWALKNVSFEVKQGEVLGIIGKNGAGKSTLLKILSQITQPTHGEIRVKGKIASLLEVGTGFHPELSGRENIFLNGAILGMKKKEISNKFDEIVSFSGVEKFIDTPVKRYSSGMYVRLAFAVAAHLEPEILIVDEVLAVGDAEFQKKCLGKMKDVSGQGRTVLFVSHNMTAMKSLCSKGLFLKNGMLEKEGSIRDVIDFYMEEAEDKNKISYVFDEDKKKEAQILEIGIIDDKKEYVREVDLNKTFSIVIKYVIRKSMSGLIAGFSISQSKESEYLIVSNEAELDPDRLKTRKPGYYTNVITVPEKILNVGKYKIKVGITAQKNIYDVIDDIFFTVCDNVGIVQALGYDRKYSILSIQLPWKSQLIESVG